MRQGRRGIRGAFAQVEARMTQTGANADEWVPARPGTEGVLALGLAHAIIAAKLKPADAAGRAGALVAGWEAGLADYAPDAVEKLTGVAAARVERLARELAERSPSVVIVGGPPLAHTNALFTALAVNALNALLGSVNTPGGLSFTPQLDVAAAAKLPGPAPAAAPTLQKLAGDLLAGGASMPQVVVVDGANPVFTAPPGWMVRDALLKAPTLVSVGSFLDETSVLADLILPDHSYLESWTDAVPESGARVAVASVAPPVMRPLHQTRATADVLLDISKRLGRPVEWPWETFEEMLGASFAALPPAAEGGDAWSEAQEQGGWWGALPAALTRGAGANAAGASRPQPVSFTEPLFDGDSQQYPFYFLPYASSTFLDGSLAHLPWLQEMPDPLTSAMWSTWVEVNPATAAKLGVAVGDVVEVTSGHGTLQAAVYVSPGLAPDIIAMPAGQGHATFTRYASGRGANPVAILSSLTEAATGAPAWAATRVKVSRVGGPDGRLILFAGGMREHGEHDEPPGR
jgi:anaerobic selenocysteine-containing dehydrogenase